MFGGIITETNPVIPKLQNKRKELKTIIFGHDCSIMFCTGHMSLSYYICNRIFVLHFFSCSNARLIDDFLFYFIQLTPYHRIIKSCWLAFFFFFVKSEISIDFLLNSPPRRLCSARYDWHLLLLVIIFSLFSSITYQFIINISRDNSLRIQMKNTNNSRLLFWIVLLA